MSFDEIEDILFLEESYNKDSPASIGKSLLLNRLVFSGKKSTGETVAFDQTLYNGINIWIADNHKGKSTIFKIIKFALTGNDSIKKDIKPWIEEILLEFTIGKVTYTCHIDRTGRDRGSLYRFTIEQYKTYKSEFKLDVIEKQVEFSFNSRQDLEDKLQSFFFEQFSFYILKYTQKSSAKDSFDLNTSSLSWSTYFKSIYLESNNYEHLFFEQEKIGLQGKKIFEMVLGLPLTYPINMLKIQQDRVNENIGKIKLVDKSRIDTAKTSKEELDKRYQEVIKELESAGQNSGITFQERPLIEEYSAIQHKVNKIRKEQRDFTEFYQAEKTKLNRIEDEFSNLQNDRRKVDAEILRLQKQELNMDLYRQSQSFFTNLDIKACPHCEIKVSDDKKEKEKEQHICSLCGEESKEQKIEEAEILQKSSQIQQEIKIHNERLAKITKSLDEKSILIKDVKKKAEDYSAKISLSPSIEMDNKRLNEIEDEIALIAREREKHKDKVEKKEELIKEQAVLNFQLEEIKRNQSTIISDELDNLNFKKTVLEFALSALEKKRSLLNKDILGKLEALILKEVNAFGLKSITKVIISEKYELIYTQNDVQIGFNDLSEGEKLRAKLAFYLSLIQLDIEHSLGRHPRFLIFDSPGSEEMVPQHLKGLAEIFKDINNRFEKELQIFVGSALREFSQITDEDRTFIKKEDEFVF
ncbi:hypothetical protein GON26_11635 [Flavobacterium sp. GA093]|uniref:Rad50/SbcC-type AAA domain-containing protein n=1 Tax=Flavobacterium hydrocarbonoxydans TaxID=2683249 RepID=A0A6I4NTL5_9FLAO|nr:hypothetical protein [Flavobacterium hydrocarbonoxydans]MWB95019.1 hypothetical protein [Flavobacterium hydrocarbonoxydans]